MAEPAEGWSLAVSAVPTGPKLVEFTVTTNIPTPVQAMADVSLTGLKDNDTWIGIQEKVTLTGPTTKFTLDGSDADRTLPAGDYDAEISFYARWGPAGNLAAALVPDLEARVPIRLTGDGGTPAEAKKSNERQKWVMENVIVGTPWSESKFVARLGDYDKSASTLSRLHDAYYFPGADMTLIVNRVRNEVSIWRMGQVSQ